MSFKEDIKVKDEILLDINQNLMKDYSKQEILKTFNFMLKRIEKTGEIEGDIENTKITRN